MHFDAEIFKIQCFYGLGEFQLRLVFIRLHTFYFFNTLLRQYLLPPLKNSHLILAVLLEMGHRLSHPQGHSRSKHPADHHHKHGKLNQVITIIGYRNSRYMVDNLSLQLDPRRIKQQNDLKKLLPKGSCSIDQFKKYEYIRSFLKDRFLYRYILPINHIYAPFVVIKRIPENEKFPIFQLYHHPTHTFVLAAQEQNMNIGCNYLISIRQKPAKDQFFVAKLRGNFNRNQFNIFDNGSNPDRSKNNPRKQLGYITVEEGSLWNKNQKMTMFVPRAYESNRSISEIHKYQPIQFICQSKKPNPIMTDYKEKYNTVESLQLKQLKSIQNKQSSPQSFILQSSIRTQTVVIRKKSETYYQLGIGSPLTIVQGFAFLLAMIQSKMV